MMFLIGLVIGGAIVFLKDEILDILYSYLENGTIESEDFYNRCQTYRLSPAENQEYTTQAYKDLIAYIDGCFPIYGTNSGILLFALSLVFFAIGFIVSGMMLWGNN